MDIIHPGAICSGIFFVPGLKPLGYVLIQVRKMIEFERIGLIPLMSNQERVTFI